MGYGRSNGDDFSFKKSKMAAAGHICYTKLATNGYKFDTVFDYRAVLVCSWKYYVNPELNSKYLRKTSTSVLMDRNWQTADQDP